jgi:hypothetical protein
MTAEGRTRPNLHLLLEGLHEQRIYRTIAGDKKLARRVQRHLHGSVAAATHANLRASHDLRSLVTPRKHAPKFKLAKPDAPGRLRRYYKAGQRRFGIKWQILAALNFVESKFGRVLGPSSSGAEGPMQFLPSTWKQYGNGGNIWDPHDSIIAAARYLHASGGPRDMHDALYAYNRSRAYVDAILTYARRMETKTINYYDYWLWQAFAITTHGDVQLTGPGSRQRH